MKILIINPYYLPGYRSGGPQQTVQNICDVFSGTHNIYLVTKDRDLGETKPYNVETGKWLDRYGIHVMYVEPEQYNRELFKKLYQRFDTFFACGLFCSSTIQLMLIHRDEGKRLYVAPMGVFSKNALAIRGFKKSVFLKLFSIIGAFKRATWSFTSKEELNEAISAIGKKNIKNYIIAEDLPRSVDFDSNRANINGSYGVLKIVFLSRIVPKKNLLYAIKILRNEYAGQIQFDIYGTKEDIEYWHLCEKEINNLPSNVKCHYCGSVKPDESVSAFAAHDIFLFPTRGENFGHVIYEALAGGCIPIISDTTPWKDFDEKHCGNVISLDDIDGFRNAIQVYLDMPPEELLRMKMNAIDYAERKYQTSIATSGYKAIFDAPVTNMGGGTAK